ncbi:Pro-apoptotic serine protease NMA111 [Colletotrichum fructicola]|nr:Pro-apoptotic serine protease NMA111 [Colletotrichum fructicola]
MSSKWTFACAHSNHDQISEPADHSHNTTAELYHLYKVNESVAFSQLFPDEEYQDWTIRELHRRAIKASHTLTTKKRIRVKVCLSKAVELRQTVSTRYKDAPVESRVQHHGFLSLIQSIITLLEAVPGRIRNEKNADEPKRVDRMVNQYQVLECEDGDNPEDSECSEKSDKHERPDDSGHEAVSIEADVAAEASIREIIYLQFLEDIQKRVAQAEDGISRAEAGRISFATAAMILTTLLREIKTIVSVETLLNPSWFKSSDLERLVKIPLQLEHISAGYSYWQELQDCVNNIFMDVEDMSKPYLEFEHDIQEPMAPVRWVPSPSVCWVVGAGPFWGSVVFENHDEVDVYSVYCDPVHDFGFLRFDPKAVKHTHCDGLQLRPDLAAVGLQTRIVGNDAGEKVSILPAIISRLDPNAPTYGQRYCDFNTCYYQAHASATGGSSGSPVVNIDGFVVALLAGGRTDDASTDFFLPLDRPLRALRCLQADKPIPRGDIQCQFLFKPFDECNVRQAFPSDNNLLVAETVLPNGPSNHKIEEGDIIMMINGEIMTKFERFDDILDSNVNGTIRLQLQRGGEDLQFEIDVGDLHVITPNRFVSFAGAIFHTLSYQMARRYAVACQGVFVSGVVGASSFFYVGAGCIILSVGNTKVPDLDTFVKVMEAIPDESKVVVSYKHIADLHTLHHEDICIDRHWFPRMELGIRNDKTGQWDFVKLADPLSPTVSVPGSAHFTKLESLELRHAAAADVVQSLVHIDFVTPLQLDGYPFTRCWTMGLVIDAEKGLVVASRGLLPFDLCDVKVTIAHSVTVSGKICFLHPLENYVIVQYDPQLVGAPVRSARLSTERISPGTLINFVGYNEHRELVHTSTTVTDVRSAEVPATSSIPRYRTPNLDHVTVDTKLSLACGSGVLVSDSGVIQALWFSYLGEWSNHSHKHMFYNMGLATSALLPVVYQVREGIIPSLRMLPVQFSSIALGKAKPRGLSDDWIGKITRANKTRLFMVSRRTVERSEQSTPLLEGDLLLTLNGRLVVEVFDLNAMYNHEVLDVVVIREGREHRLKVNTVTTDDLSELHSDVYITFNDLGSPADHFHLKPTDFITHVDGHSTPNLEVFSEITKKIPDNTYFRLKIVTSNNVRKVVTMKKNEHYFPLKEWIKDACGWRMETFRS